MLFKVQHSGKDSYIDILNVFKLLQALKNKIDTMSVRASGSDVRMYIILQCVKWHTMRIGVKILRDANILNNNTIIYIIQEKMKRIKGGRVTSQEQKSDQNHSTLSLSLKC